MPYQIGEYFDAKGFSEWLDHHGVFVCLGFGLVWFGLVWFGVVWFGLVWFGLFLFCLFLCLCQLSFSYLKSERVYTKNLFQSVVNCCFISDYEQATHRQYQRLTKQMKPDLHQYERQREKM